MPTQHSHKALKNGFCSDFLAPTFCGCGYLCHSITTSQCKEVDQYTNRLATPHIKIMMTSGLGYNLLAVEVQNDLEACCY
jgi:hypothetical protein